MMQLAAFLCVICAICGRIHIQTYSINIHRRNPSISRRSRRLSQTKPKTATTATITQPVFLCDIMQPAAFVCVICAICGRIYARGLNQSPQKNPQCLPQISQITQMTPNNHINSNLSFSAK